MEVAAAGSMAPPVVPPIVGEKEVAAALAAEMPVVRQRRVRVEDEEEGP